MRAKWMLVAILLVLGLGALGLGVWLLGNPVTEEAPEDAGLTELRARLADTSQKPAITMRELHIMGGSLTTLFVYADGTVIAIEDTQRRIPPPEGSLRTWKLAQLAPEELNALMSIVRSGFPGLEAEYQKQVTTEGSSGDMDLYILVNSGDINKSVRAFGYYDPRSPLVRATFAGLPAPLEAIFEKLWTISQDAREVASERFKP